jgi:hypothetical protein
MLPFAHIDAGHPYPNGRNRYMSARSVILLAYVGVVLAASPALASPVDVETCLAAADKATDGLPLADDEKRAGHEACQRALADSANIMNKYHLQEADFDIVGRPPH